MRRPKAHHRVMLMTELQDAHGDQTRRGYAHGGRGSNRKRLAITLGLVVAYMLAEIVGGLLTISLALLADAGHMLSDAGALALSLSAMWIARRPATPQRTFGYYRTEILAALANGATLVAISLFVFVEAWQRFHDPPEVRGALMMGIATGGLVVNLVGLRILSAGRDESLNMRGAWLHVRTDALGEHRCNAGRFSDLGFRLGRGHPCRVSGHRVAHDLRVVEPPAGECVGAH